MMNGTPALPVWPNEHLAGLSLEQLIDLLIRDEDRAPRNVIDRCAAYGEEMVELLRAKVDSDHAWRPDVSMGEWWLGLHAVMILGLVASESAGLLLVSFMRRMALSEDFDLQDWFAGHWPSLFRNKPQPVVDAARALSEDRALDWYIRCQAADVVIDAAMRDGVDALNSALDRLAAHAADESENWEFRLAVGNTLLDFPRERHRPLLADLAARQKGLGAHFSPQDVEKFYAHGRDQPDWARFENPWKFYAPGAIARRQDRWAEEAAGENEDVADIDGEFFDEPAIPHVRETPKVGRNDPCPCGSGKKYKHCCLGKEDAAAAPAPPGITGEAVLAEPNDLLWHRLHRFDRAMATQLLDFSVEVFGKAALGEAWAEFAAAEDSPFNLGSPHLQVFMPWFYFNWPAGDPDTRVKKSAPRDETVAGAYLRMKGRHLDPVERRYLQTCIETPFSFHEVVRCEPGKGFRLRDLFTGEEREVSERSGSRYASQGDLLLGKVMPIEHLALLEGCSGVAFPPQRKAPIIELRNKMKRPGQPLTRERLHDYDHEMIDLYLEVAEQLLHPRLPELRNTDGEVLTFHKLRYDIDSPQAAFDALKGLAEGESEDALLSVAERDEKGALRSVGFGWLKRGNAQHAHWDNTVLGHIEIDGKTLSVEVNSRERAERFREIADRLLEGVGRYKTALIESTEAALERLRAQKDSKAARESEDLKARPEVQALMAKHLDAHYETWPQTRLPALGGKTPLEAVKSPDGREMVEALVAQIERGLPSLYPGSPEALIARLRARLGLSG